MKFTPVTGASRSSDSADYSPISCDFHDTLEAAATTRNVVRVSFLDERGALQHRSATIVDVYSRSRVEYIAMSTGETLRLDRLVAVDDTRRIDL